MQLMQRTAEIKF